jgi:hypothetical protein
MSTGGGLVLVWPCVGLDGLAWSWAPKLLSPMTRIHIRIRIANPERTSLTASDSLAENSWDIA